MKWIWMLVAVVTLSAACSSAGGDSAATTTTPADPESVLVTVEQSGGCMMMGPNCPTYVVHANGRVMLLRTGGSGEPVDSTFVDPALTTDLAWLMTTTDYTDLRARLPQGECQGCYDGIDTIFVFAAGPSAVAFNSIDTVLDPSEPLLRAVWRIVEAAGIATEMPLEARP
jgi:hypothetical protein